MQTELNIDRLSELLANLYELTGLQISLHNTTGEEIYSILQRSAFCDVICGTEEGYRRCVACDAAAVRELERLCAPREYRCHAGIIDSAIPITDKGNMVAIILFGQILDDSPLDEQWDLVRSRCEWYPWKDQLRETFLQLPRLTASQIRACYQIINACVSEMRLEGFIRAGERTDAQRLVGFINTHYTSPLSLELISEALSIGKTRLYQLAESIEPGLTITGMITRRRIATAKRLLDKPGAKVRDVAELVGIPDYNYFTKVFRKTTGMTPSQYREMSDER